MDGRTLADAAATVPFLGAATDQSLISITFDDAPVNDVSRRITAASTRSTLQVWKPMAGQVLDRDGDRILRGWSEGTVAFYDDAFERGGEPVVGDVRIPDTRYRIDNTDTATAASGTAAAEPAAPVVIREFTRGTVTMRTFATLATRIRERLDGVDVRLLPALDRNRADSVRGVIFAGPGRWDGLRAAAGIVTDEPLSDAVSLTPATWCAPSTLWESATPVASHRDPKIARAHVEHDLRAQGLHLVAIDPKPWQPWQSRRLAIGGEYGLWFITAAADEPIPGPICIGSCQQAGAGLLRPTKTAAVSR